MPPMPIYYSADKWIEGYATTQKVDRTNKRGKKMNAHTKKQQNTRKKKSSNNKGDTQRNKEQLFHSHCIGICIKYIGMLIAWLRFFCFLHTSSDNEMN